MDWTSLAPNFERDGALRDICVLGTTVDDWQRVMDALVQLEPPPSFSLDGKPAELPACAARLFELRSVASTLLTLNLESIQINCHFFGGAEIEFDLDPRDITGPAQFDVVLAFMKLLAETTGKVAILTHENAKEKIIFSASPSF